MQFDVTAGHARLRFRQRQSAIESTVERSASFWEQTKKAALLSHSLSSPHPMKAKLSAPRLSNPHDCHTRSWVASYRISKQPCKHEGGNGHLVNTLHGPSASCGRYSAAKTLTATRLPAPAGESCPLVSASTTTADIALSLAIRSGVNVEKRPESPSTLAGLTIPADLASRAAGCEFAGRDRERSSDCLVIAVRQHRCTPRRSAHGQGGAAGTLLVFCLLLQDLGGLAVWSSADSGWSVGMKFDKNQSTMFGVCSSGC